VLCIIPVHQVYRFQFYVQCVFFTNLPVAVTIRGVKINFILQKGHLYVLTVRCMYLLKKVLLNISATKFFNRDLSHTYHEMDGWMDGWMDN